MKTGEKQGGCKVCIWWTRNDTITDMGSCHLNAPQAGSGFGWVPEDGYCGQWEAREGEEWRHHEVTESEGTEQ